jgi:hypothetical protein
MIVLTGLPFGTVSWNCASWGAAACDELELRAVPTDGSGAPGRVTNTADGRLVEPDDPPRPAPHFGMRSTRKPPP